VSLKAVIDDLIPEELMEDLIIMETKVLPEEVRIHRGHMTNGIPSWAVPKNVRWSGDCRLWYYVVPDRSCEKEYVKEATAYQDHIPDYPCQIEDLVETQEFLKVLEVAEVNIAALYGDLQRRMRVLKWLHHCNVEAAKRWRDYYSQFPMEDILSHPIWYDMGRMLRSKEHSWEARGGKEIDEAILFCDLDGVLADFEKGLKKLFPKDRRRSSHSLWPRIRRAPAFFENLEWMKDGKVLWDHIKDFEPIIMTGVPPGSWAIEQKKNWLKREIGNVRATFCRSRDKSIYKPECLPSAILIDDREFLRDQWEKSGGIFVHHTSTLNTLKQLQSIGLIEEIDYEYLHEQLGAKDPNQADVLSGGNEIQL